ncbi:MAG: hypothetical protein Q9201_004195 [Fulgogasparrea decipioides]
MERKPFMDIIKALVDEPYERLDLPESRRELLTALYSLIAKLESPTDSIERFIFQPHQNAAIRIAINLNLFVLVGEKGTDGVNAEELSYSSGAEPALIGQAYVFDEAAFSLSRMPAYLEETEYKNPTDDARGPFQFAFQTPFGMFEFLNQRPKRLNVFNTFMEGQREGRVPWFATYEVEQSLCNDFKSRAENSVLIVDVGGNRGHDMVAFRNAFPTQPGRLIVQDLPETIRGIEHPVPGVEFMEYDFFTPQSVIG